MSGHLVACHYAEAVKAGRIRPKEREPVLDAGASACRIHPAADLEKGWSGVSFGS